MLFRPSKFYETQSIIRYRARIYPRIFVGMKMDTKRDLEIIEERDIDIFMSLDATLSVAWHKIGIGLALGSFSRVLRDNRRVASRSQRESIPGGYKYASL